MRIRSAAVAALAMLALPPAAARADDADARQQEIDQLRQEVGKLETAASTTPSTTAR